MNIADKEASGNINIENFANRKAEIHAVNLAVNLADIHTPHEPEKIKPVKRELLEAADTINYRFPPRSYTLLRFDR